jgi:hypothetical protein
MKKKLSIVVLALLCLLVSLCALNQVKANGQTTETFLTINLDPLSIKVTESATITVWVEYPISPGESGTVGPDEGNPARTIDFYYRSDAAASQDYLPGPQDVPIGPDGSTVWVFHPEDWGIGEGESVEFGAVFEGDEPYLGSENYVSNPLYIVPTQVVPEYALGGLLALAACFAGFLAFKKLNGKKL